MALYRNEMRVTGRFTRDANEPKPTKNGRMINFGIASSRGVKDKQSGDWKNYDQLFLDCTFFGGDKTDWLVQMIFDKGKKGANVFVEGVLVTEEWEDKNGGGKRSKNCLKVDKIDFLDARESTGSSEDSAPAQRGGQQQSAPVDDTEIPF